MIKNIIKSIKNKFQDAKVKLKKQRVISHAINALIEIGAYASLDEAILKTGYEWEYSPEETADLIINLEKFLGTDLLLWQENKSIDEKEDLVRSFIRHVEKHDTLPAM